VTASSYVYNAKAATCHLFHTCTNPIEGTVSNPVLGDVPACTGCASVTGATLTPLPEGATVEMTFVTDHEIEETDQ
jgi:hypothetical protein